MLPAMNDQFRSGDALVVFDKDLLIVDWNAAAEALTGIPAQEALGRPCWDVLRGIDARGSLICHTGCSGARLMRRGWPVSSQRIQITTSSGGRKPVSMATIRVRGSDGPLFVHVLRNGEEIPAGENGRARPARLTDRQREVLRLLEQGLSAKRIAEQLGIAEPTVRNHIRGILVELTSHSQLEALAKARKLGLVE